MKRLILALFLLTCSTSPSWAAGLKLSIQDGLVTLDAQDVTVRQILTEWARIGKTQIVNVERITGGPITLTLQQIPEKQALDIILRSIPGYMAMPRVAIVADASIYDRILIMPTTTAVAAVRPPQPAPGFPGMQTMPGALGGANVTQLRQMQPAPLSPGMLPDSQNPTDQSDDPAIANAAAAGLVTVPAFTPGPTPFSAPLVPPGGGASSQQPAQTTPGVGAPTNPWNAPVGTSRLAPPAPAPQAPPPPRMRPPQADR
jgi:hypothetical protein